MNKLVEALGPAFAAGFAVQQLLEILDSVLEKLKFVAENKKAVFGLLAVIAGLLLAFGAGLRVLQPLGLDDADLWDALVTALIISAGTEGFNSIVKFLGYAKENKKSEAALKKADAKGKNALALVERT